MPELRDVRRELPPGRADRHPRHPDRQILKPNPGSVAAGILPEKQPNFLFGFADFSGRPASPGGLVPAGRDIRTAFLHVGRIFAYYLKYYCKFNKFSCLFSPK